MIENQDRQMDNWGDLANKLAQTWTETGTQMWKSWMDLMGTSGKTVENARPGFQHLAQQFAENQDLAFRLLQLSFQSWQQLMPQVEAGGNWQQALADYSAQMRQQLDQFSQSNLKATQDTAELWQLYLKEMQKFNQLWVESLRDSFGPLSQTAPGRSEPWIELNNLYWNLLYEQTFGSLMQSPILGPSREFNGKLLRAFDAWTDLYRASLDYQAVLADVQVRSFEALMQELVSLAEKGETVRDWRQFQQIWSQVADRIFEEAFCQEQNLKIRGKFINSLNTYRLHQQGLTELWMKMMDLPVRSEVDEIHKNIYELRREVKQLKKALAKSQSHQERD